jgi:3'-5' exoribonuclease
MFVREMQEGCEVEQVLLVRAAQNRDDHLRLTLADRTGSLSAVGRDGLAHARPGTFVWVRGRLAGGELLITALRPAETGEYELADLLDGPAKPVEELERDLREVVATIQEPQLLRLLDSLLGEGSATWRAYRDGPAAKRYHQAYSHGLLEHSVGVAKGVHLVSGTFPGIDHDVAVTGALLHDIGKLEAYGTVGHAIDLTDAGKLQGEIPLGYYRVRRAIEELGGFPEDLAQAVLHIILSHHGSLEHGSPVVPCTREATLVHAIDNLGGKLGSFDRLEKELAEGQRWSSFDRAIGTGAFFAAPAAIDEAAAA